MTGALKSEDLFRYREMSVEGFSIPHPQRNNIQPGGALILH